MRSARYIAGVMHGDAERASEGLKAWGAAAQDPSWWLQVGMGYVGAAQPAPRVQTPNLTVLPGGGARIPPAAGNLRTAFGAECVNPARSDSLGRRHGDGCRSLSRASPLPVTPAPAAPAPRPALQGLPTNPNPRPVAPRVNPPSPIAASAAIGATAMTCANPPHMRRLCPRG